MNRSLSHLVLPTCQSLKSLKTTHARLIIDGSITSSDLALNKILRLYSRFGATIFARKLFDEITDPNPFLWTSLIHGYVENNQYNDAFDMFFRMRCESIPLLNFTLSSILKALGRLKRSKYGEAIHGFVLKYGFGSDLILQNAMIDLFMRCGEVDSARRVFDEMDETDVVSWNSMISGYVNNDKIDIARKVFDKSPDRNVISWTSIISGYVKAGEMVEAKHLFDAMPSKDMAVWRVMISGYIDAGDLHSARLLFDEMPTHDIGTWNLMISGFCKIGEIKLAEDYFNRIPYRNLSSWTIMIDGYVKSENLSSAKLLFDQMPKKNLVPWSIMIGGYARNGHPRIALELFEKFKDQGIKTDETFILAIIGACSQLGVLDSAESVIRDYIGVVGPSLFSNLPFFTSLIDMYAKCGNIKKAIELFETAIEKDLLCYSTMISAYANHGLIREAISLFEDMKKAKMKPDGVTFLVVLSACNHGGLVNEGKSYFQQMSEEFQIQPTEKHYACVIDLLARGGCIEEAYGLIRGMPVAPTSAIWGSLLSACNVHGNVKMAEIAAAELFKIEPDNSGNYILLSNMYAASGQWCDVANIRAKIRENRVRKNRGSSWIELGSVVHEFVMRDLSHIDSGRIYFVLYLIYEDMKLSGYLVNAKQGAMPSSTLSFINDLESG